MSKQEETAGFPYAAVVLRKATHADADPLRVLHRTSLTVLGPDHYSADQVRSLLRYVPTLDPELIEDETYFVAEAYGWLVACGGWSARVPGYHGALSPSSTDTPSADRLARIRAMYTHPAWTRRGLARRILDAAEQEALRAGYEVLELDALLGGVPVYRAAGYQALEVISPQLPDGTSLPVVRMRKQVAPTDRGAFSDLLLMEAK